jgi:Glycosyl transferases group 1
MKVLFKRMHHFVGNKEYARLKRAFARVGIELYDDSDRCDEFDLLMVRGWAYTWRNVEPWRHVPVIYYSVGTEWKVNADLYALNEPVRELYERADAVVHISAYCRLSHERIFTRARSGVETVIMPACPPNLPQTYPCRAPGDALRLATTCLPRPVKRVGELQRLARAAGVDLVEAYGGVEDFSYYHQCDGFIHLSRKEGLGNSILEAMSHGLPCIVTNYGGAAEVVGDAGIVIRNDPDNVPWDDEHIEPIDPVLFDQAIADLRARLPALRLKVRERVLTELNDYVTACRFKEVFLQIVHGGRGQSDRARDTRVMTRVASRSGLTQPLS